MMRHSSRLFRLSASVAIGALLSGGMLPVAVAQPIPPVQAPSPDQTQGDPPSRVGRIAGESGAVAFRTSADTQWSPATANYPVSSGNAFWTEPSARAELQISASHIDLSGQTEFDVTTLDASGLQAVSEQGEVYLHLADLAPNEVWSVQTPRGTVRLTQAGRYGIVVGTADQPTQITVVEGAAAIDGPGVSLTVGPNQTATVTGAGPFQGSIGPEMRDAFLAARLAAERPPASLPAPISARLRYLPEITDLSGTGEWQQEPDYGEVWYPPVAPGWVPYQYGEWTYVAPWGWTWVDSAPWGFVPFHYGRWAHIGRRWGWIPGDLQAAGPAVYAPALVAFVGLAAAGTVGWVPLGPGEAYHPWYHASGGYIRQINAGHVQDPAVIGNQVALGSLINRGAATMVPASVMLGSRPVRPEARLISPQTLASARPLVGEQPIPPAVGTLGVTPAIARQLNLRPVAGIAPPRFVAGPVVRVQEPGLPNGARPLPGLIGPHGEQAGIPHPGGPAVPGPGAAQTPGAPLPPVLPGNRPSGLPGTPETRPPGAPAAPHPETEIQRPPGVPPLPGPGGHPPGEVRPAQPGAIPPRPEGHEVPPVQTHEPPGQLPIIERPSHEPPAPRRAPEVQQGLPRVAAPEPPHPPPHFAPEPPRAPPPRVEQPRPPPPPHVEPPRPAPQKPEPPQR